MANSDVDGYRERVVRQTRMWANGDAVHNDIDAECCPDFSCCEPHLFEQDRSKRMQRLNEVLIRYGLAPHYDA